MKRYQEGLEAKMKGSSYIFESIDLLEYHLHKISLNRGSSYIDSPTLRFCIIGGGGAGIVGGGGLWKL